MRPINLGIFAAIVLALVCLINIGNQAKGSEYYEAVVGHVIQNADKIDHSQYYRRCDYRYEDEK